MKILKTFKKDNNLFNKGSIFEGTIEEAQAINEKIPNAIEVLETTEVLDKPNDVLFQEYLEQPKPKRKRNRKV